MIDLILLFGLGFMCVAFLVTYGILLYKKQRNDKIFKDLSKAHINWNNNNEN